MDLNFAVFQEPRGVMRIFHFVFSIVSFATTVDFIGTMTVDCKGPKVAEAHSYSYPFDIHYLEKFENNSCIITLDVNFSSDAKFYVCTGVLAMLYSIAIIVVYLKFDDLYRKNENVPLIDFGLSVFLSLLWLSSSAAWANGVAGLKSTTSNPIISDSCKPLDCTVSTGSFSTLNISIIVGFLNFFLWAANLWFLYKETKFFAKPPNPDV